MNTFLITALYLALLAAPLPEGDEKIGDGTPIELDSIVVNVGRADRHSPIANVSIDSELLKKAEPSSSLPMALGMLPSTVSSSEGGTGLGYTSFRIRGVSAYQTNVTLNGITLNDAESQQVFWVNIPALSHILHSVQIQRGLGTSSCGPGAFGSSVNMSTLNKDMPGASAELSYGSFNTIIGTAEAASGLFGKGFFAEGTFSIQHSDGFIRNAPADVASIYASAGWKDASNTLSLTFLQGRQKTGITWEGVPFDIYPDDPQYNSAPGCFDEFKQSHLQLNYLHSFGGRWMWHSTLNWTDGIGWYSYPSTRDTEDNDLYVLRSEVQWLGTKLQASAGIYLSLYDGGHYGDLDGVRRYENNAVKSEGDFWGRAEWKAGEKISLYGDIQFRSVRHRMLGPDEYGQYLSYDERWNFFNPRAGITYIPAKGHRTFFSIALGNREPARADIQAVFSEKGKVRPERMADFELGYAFQASKFTAEAGLYAMEYRDMLLETGKLNSSGYAIKENINSGFRRGIELSAAWKALSWLDLSANLNLSANRFLGSDSFCGTILLSPSAVAGGSIALKSSKGGRIQFDAKYVGRQYWDNSTLDSRIVPAYFIVNASAAQAIGKHIELGLYVTNLTGLKYYSYAYEGGVYPQAPRAFTLKLSAEF